ncbi:MAG: type II toxin-antitoxin system VapC family toxin [Vulcanococcus sp.]|uniref:type II toxin-antitoxin system VapC family toxin n=1 Tax=Vulcanococcus sp. TaxID=2856995 RepID=UPI0025D6F5DD|nr:type II toxin-antitoxin system VapC family toxin [Vulcanococcus sp.]MBW0167170.1 type II toxin-antitoxin system VapC family toxin [Vulcanococcus sp.]
MRVTADTNLLVRVLVQDDLEQARAAMDLLSRAELVAVPLPVLCELVWVLKRVYGFVAADCVAAIEVLLATRAVVTDRPAARAGLRLLAAGGDFADAVIAFSGRRLGGERFVSFDRRAVQLLADQGESAELLE